MLKALTVLAVSIILIASVKTLFVLNSEDNPPAPDAISSIQNVKAEGEAPEEAERFAREITDVVSRGESLFDIFKKHGLKIEELFSITEASASVYQLKRIRTSRPYTIGLDAEDRVSFLSYSIDDDSFLSVQRDGDGAYSARKLDVQYETRIRHMGGVVNDNLVSSLDDLLLALSLSDIFAWDIDFNTDLRKGDSFRMVVQALYLDGEFRKFGRILSAEFINNGSEFRAYWFEEDGARGYYDDDGKSLRRSFLKAPLSFRRISSGYTNRRYHPILKRYWPHLGVDYAAPAGTPVSSPASGTVVSRGYKGQNGRQIIIRHANGYRTYYGHLSRYAKAIRKGARVKQGQVIGYVGSTGLSTGPHLDYRIKRNGSFINPLRLKSPRLSALPDSMRAAFEAVKTRMGRRLASIHIRADQSG